MKVLFVNAINTKRLYEVNYQPLNLAYLVSALINHHDINVDCKIVSGDKYFTELADFDPDVVCISCVTQNYNAAKEIAETCKAVGTKVIIGGVHISALPNTLTKDMDIGVIGEGEQTIVELFKNGFKNLNRVKGIVYWKDGKLKKTPNRPLVENLDDIDPPAREYLKIDNHTFMFTSRGCPYKCVFCASTRFWGSVRFHSAERVVSEMKELINRYGVEYIEMFDDLFIADKRRLRDIADLMEKEDIKVKIGCSARANMVDDDTMFILKQMGVQKIVLGLESGNDRILTYLKGIDGYPTVSVKDNYNAVKLANKYGILVNAGLVIGSPDETREEIMDTYKMAKTSGLNHFETYLITPLPNTPIWDLAKEKGLVSDDDFDWSKLDVMFGENWEDAIVVSDTLSREELHELYLKFKKLQFKARIHNALRHPIKNDVPRLLKKIIFEGAKI